MFGCTCNCSFIRLFLKFWFTKKSCDWTGTQIDIENHIKIDHAILGDMFKHKDEQMLPFDANINSGTLNLINAFCRRFVLYYHTNRDKAMVYFCIFLLGKRAEASRYTIGFSIYSTMNPNEKVNSK